MKSFGKKDEKPITESSMGVDREVKQGVPGKKDFQPASWYRETKGEKAASDPGKITTKKIYLG